MIKLVLFSGLLLASLGVNAAPSIDGDAAPLQNLTELAGPEPVVKYDGAQLWRVDFDHAVAKQAVFELQRIYGRASIQFSAFIFPIVIICL